jgi:hypothetical protein
MGQARLADDGIGISQRLLVGSSKIDLSAKFDFDGCIISPKVTTTCYPLTRKEAFRRVELRGTIHRFVLQVRR